VPNTACVRGGVKKFGLVMRVLMWITVPSDDMLWQFFMEYQAPPWASPCGAEWRLEIIKDGTLLESIPLGGRSHLKLGRLPGNDVICPHESVSRHHAVLQHGARHDSTTDSASTSNKGWWIFDLGSTHGTFVSKKRVDARSFHRCWPGERVQVGCSTRHLVLVANEDDSSVDRSGDDREQYRSTPVHILPTTIQRPITNLETHFPAQAGRLEDEADEDIVCVPGRIRGRKIEDICAEMAVREQGTAIAASRGEDAVGLVRRFLAVDGFALEAEYAEVRQGQYQATFDVPDIGDGYSDVTFVGIGERRSVALEMACRRAWQVLVWMDAADHTGKILQRQSRDMFGLQGDRRLGGNSEDRSDEEDQFYDRTAVSSRKRAREHREEPTQLNYEQVLEKLRSLAAELKILREASKESAASGTQLAGSEDVDPLDTFMASVDSSLASEKMVRLHEQVQQTEKEIARFERYAEQLRPYGVRSVAPARQAGIDHLELASKSQASTTARCESCVHAEVVADSVQQAHGEDASHTEDRTVSKGPPSLPAATLRVPSAHRPGSGVPTTVVEDASVIGESVWLPPVGQSGNGWTPLNDKFGY
jgi:hypothetical protein